VDVSVRIARDNLPLALVLSRQTAWLVRQALIALNSNHWVLASLLVPFI
jgi:hypothetical protein